MTLHRQINESANAAVAAFLADYPEATITDVLEGLRDAMADASTVFDAARPMMEAAE